MKILLGVSTVDLIFNLFDVSKYFCGKSKEMNWGWGGKSEIFVEAAKNANQIVCGCLRWCMHIFVYYIYQKTKVH